MPYVALSVEPKAGITEGKYEIAFEKPKWRDMTRALNSKHRKKPYSFI